MGQKLHLKQIYAQPATFITATRQQLSVAVVEQLDLLLLLTSCHGDGQLPALVSEQ